jgi:hypothetical protein
MRITAKVRAEVFRLDKVRPRLSMHEISEITGLKNIGRVSEILRRKR